MDQRLVEAARVGDVLALHRILVEDPQILEKASLAFFAESPLHVAALAGKVDFVKEIIRLMSSLATETNQQGLIPLHIASAVGHVEIVKELLKVKPDEVNQCLLKDDEGRTPLHYAVIRGRVEVIEELINYCPECLEEVTAKGETVLHLAVKANKFGAVKVLVDRIKRLPNFQTLFGAKDNKGKTVDELVAAKKQFRVLDIGKEDEKADIKEENCITVEEDHPDKENCITVEQDHPDTEALRNEENEASQESAEERGEDQVQFQNTVLVVATLIITLTYQGLLNPPSTLVNQGTEIDWGCLFNVAWRKNYRFRLLKIMKHCPALLAFFFLTINTAIFLQSIFLVVLTLRGRRVFLLRLLTVLLTFSYSTLLMAFSNCTAYFALPLCYLALVYLFLIILREDWIKAMQLALPIVRILAKGRG